MAATLKQLVRILRAEGLNTYTNDNEALVPWGIDGRHSALTATVVDDGASVRFVRHTLFTLEEGPYREEVMLRLLEVNGRMVRGKLGVDPDDGEVLGLAEVLLADGQALRAQHVQACLRTMLPTMDDVARRLEALQQTGEWRPPYPADPDTGGADEDEVNEAVRRLLEGCSDDVSDDASLDGG